MLYACRTDTSARRADAVERMMTEYSEDLSIVESQNGMRSYHFETPLVEGYTLAREPYREFRRGIRITTFRKDSLASVDAVLTANYAIHYENRRLWEAKGDVVVRKWDGKELHTQQLFWDERTKRIYSNVDSKFVDGTRGVFIGEGFESDEQLDDWQLRYQKSRLEVETEPAEQADSTAAAARAGLPDGGEGAQERPSAARTPRPSGPAASGGRGMGASSAAPHRPAPDAAGVASVRLPEPVSADTLRTNG